METLNQIFVLFLLLLIGYVAKKYKLISNNMNHDVSNLILFIALPAMMITALSSYDFSQEMLVKSGKLIVISWCVYALSIGLAILAPKLLKIEGNDKDIFQFMVVFSNVGFMGYPVVNAVFGAEGVFYTALYNLPFNILLWTYGVMVMSRPQRRLKNSIVDKTGSFNIKMLLNPGIISVFIGFTMFLTSTKLPVAINDTLLIVGNATTPLSMIFVGSILADMEPKQVFSNKCIFLGSIMRLIFIPLIVLVVLKLFNINDMLIGIPVIITAMPAAANSAIFAAKYGNDYHMGSQAVFISTLLSMITIPLIVMLL